MAQQIARPIADVASTAGWGLTPNPPSTIYAHLNEVTPDDSSFVTSPTAGGSFTVRLSPSFRPGSAQLTLPQKLTVRLKAAAANTGVGIELLQGDAVIQRWGVIADTSFRDYPITLTPQEAASITDYTDLRVRVYNVIPLSGGGVTPVVVVPGCAYPYQEQYTATFHSPTGTCGCFAGTFPLNWNGTAWVGVYSGCMSDVTVTLSMNSGWGIHLSSASYTFAVAAPVSSCGDPPPTQLNVTVGAGCVGDFYLDVT